MATLRRIITWLFLLLKKRWVQHCKKADRLVGADKKTVKKNTGSTQKKIEVGGPAGLEPTRYGDWERRGRCIDF